MEQHFFMASLWLGMADVSPNRRSRCSRETSILHMLSKGGLLPES
jgi:hypothetical protein